MNNDNKFDVVIYGATGFTGKLVAEYMVCLLYTSDADDE